MVQICRKRWKGSNFAIWQHCTVCFQVTRDLASHTDNPSATSELLEKVRDVAETYRLTVGAAGDAIGKRVSIMVYSDVRIL